VAGYGALSEIATRADLPLAQRDDAGALLLRLLLSLSFRAKCPRPLLPDRHSRAARTRSRGISLPVALPRLSPRRRDAAPGTKSTACSNSTPPKRNRLRPARNSAPHFPQGGNMPFIRGRYHINPIAGQALEAAREAEAALLALQHDAPNSAQDQSDGFAYDNPSDASASDGDAQSNANASAGPIHRVEIEATELVPSHSGRGERGFVARVHRAAPANPSAPARPGEIPSRVYAPPPETHVFSGHGDLVNFLHDQLGRDRKH
jgi:hypothetical protein